MDIALAPRHALTLDQDRQAFVSEAGEVVISFAGRATYRYGTRVADGKEIYIPSKSYLLAMNRMCGRA